jgi:hypothetical protein
MVFINNQAKIDLDNIVIGLLEWEKVVLTVDEVMCYVDDIVDICYHLDAVGYRHRATYEEHLKYGAYAYPYKRNQKTTWYIVYDIDLSGNVFINKIISNYLTVS